MKLQIIETPEYYLAVRKDYKKIIAYLPKENASELDLPLLPKPKWFVAEVETICYCGHTSSCDCGQIEDKPFKQRLKTATNPQGKQILVGRYND